MTEFELIARYFDRPVRRARLGIGDDCALIAPSAGHALAVSTDMLVAGRHFFADADPASLGWKTLAVNLSDLAAMGATPLGFTLALALPSVDEDWLAAFSEGLFDCASRFDCELVGGDTTRGPLTLSVTIFGEVDEARALHRDRALAGDDVWVSGSLGRAALALRGVNEGRVDPTLLTALDRPVPRVALGRALLGIAHAAIDVSDGFAQDLGHIVAASRVGAEVWVDRLPFGDELGALPRVDRERLALAGGDDYELCFTAPPAARDAVRAVADAADIRVTRVGTIDESDTVTWVGATISPGAMQGFDHFA
jgi:thiamine-monophosphate kinase